MKANDTESAALFNELFEISRDDEKLRLRLEHNARRRHGIFEKLRVHFELGTSAREVQRNIRAPDAIEAFLKARGRPAKTSEITEALNEMGIIIKEASVRSALVRFHNKGIRFKRTGRNIYDLINRE